MHSFTIASLLFPEKHEVQGLISGGFAWVVVFHSALVLIILIGIIIGFRRQLALYSADIVPSAKFNILNLFEIIVSWMLGFMKELIGPRYRDYVPIVVGLWIYILLNNFFGLIPYFAPPTDNINTTASMAIVVFFATHYYGVKAHGIGYLKQFVGPIWWLAPIMIPIEVIGHFARVLSLSLRLMANMFADHTVISIFLTLTAPFVPVIFMSLGVIVCILQAFIFSILATIYFSMAIAEEH